MHGLRLNRAGHDRVRSRRKFYGRTTDRTAKTRGGAALALAALAGLALLLAWTASGGAPNPAALAQEGATRTSTPTPPFTSPRSTPTFTRTPPPRPTPQPIRFITNPTEAYALGQRYYQGERPRGGEGAIPSNTPSAPGEAVIQRFLYLPLVLTKGDWLWYKGAGKSHGYRPSGFMSQLGGSWWYDWQHDYNWGDYGNFAYRHFVPMVWCADMPREPGVPPNYSNDGNGVLGLGNWNPQELAAKVAQNRGRIWLIFNEPDHPPSDYGANLKFQQCAEILCLAANYATLAPQVTMTPGTYAQIYRLIKATDPTAKVFCCGNFYGVYNSYWWPKFLDQLRFHHSDVKIDGVAMHAYPWSVSIPACAGHVEQRTIWSNCLQEQLVNFRTAHDQELQRPDTPLAPNAPLWITEIGYLTDRWVAPGQPRPTPLTSAQVTEYLMQPMVEWLQGGGTGYEAVA